MSLKGFQKVATRTPQLFKQRFNMGDITKDEVYIDAERRFQEMENQAKKLHSESRKYFDAINGMLTHQIDFAKACAELYKPITGTKSDPNSIVDEGNPEGIAACEEYESIVHDLQDTLKPELEMIDTRVIRPALELIEVVKVMRKTNTKRDHKQIDYDRHRATLKKLQEKKDKSLKDEKAMYKAEADAEGATQEYNYFNDLLKDELPKLFELEREFIQPLFQSFYYMQLNVFYTLHERMQSIDIGYFNLTLDIEEAFEMKRGDAKTQVEALAITHFKTTGGKSRAGPAPRFSPGRPAIEGAKKPLAIEGNKSSLPPSRTSMNTSRTSTDQGESGPPPYSSSSNSAGMLATTTGAGSSKWGSAAATKAKPAPPPPKPKPSRLGGASHAETVTALYDYEAQAAGDLSFSAGDVIEIVTRTPNENEWWTGKTGGREGQFPGNYVQLN